MEKSVVKCGDPIPHEEHDWGPSQLIHCPGIKEKDQMETIKETSKCFKTEPHTSHVWHAADYTYICPGIEESIETKGDEFILECRERHPHKVHNWTSSVHGRCHCDGMGEGVKMTDAEELLASRRETYGDRVINMTRLAMIWSALLDHEILDWQVPLMMSAAKMLRAFETPDYSDNVDDVEGWTVMFREVMEANHGGIIKARTVEEYKTKKESNPEKEAEEAAMNKYMPRHPYDRDFPEDDNGLD